MTAVLAYSDGKNVWLGGDSFCGEPDFRNKCTAPKVYRINSLGIGLCGYVRQELILEKTLRKTIEPDGANGRLGVSLTEDWLKFELPDLLHTAMKEAGALKQDEGQDNFGDSAYMLTLNGKIFYLDNDFGIWDSPRNIAAIGCGKQYAIGAMEGLMSQDGMDPAKAIDKALEITARWQPYVCGPNKIIMIPAD